jgi:hypothetical protein
MHVRLVHARDAGLPRVAHVRFHCCVIDGVFAIGEDEQVRFAEAGALTAKDLTARATRGSNR